MTTMTTISTTPAPVVVATLAATVVANDTDELDFKGAKTGALAESISFV